LNFFRLSNNTRALSEVEASSDTRALSEAEALINTLAMSEAELALSEAEAPKVSMIFISGARCF